MKYAIMGDLHSHTERTKQVIEHIKEIAPDATILGLGDLYECKIGKRKASTVRNAKLEDAAIITSEFEELLTFPSIIGNQEERIALVTGLERFTQYEEKFTIEKATLLHGHQFDWDDNFEPTFPKLDTPLLFFGHSHRAAIYEEGIRKDITYNSPIYVGDKSYAINVGSVIETMDWCLYDSTAMTVTFLQAK